MKGKRQAQELFAWLRSHNYNAMLGISGTLWVYDTLERHEQGSALATRVTALPPQTQRGRKRTHRHSPVTYLSQVYVMQEVRNGPVNIIAWWERDTTDKYVFSFYRDVNISSTHRPSHS